MSRPRRSDAGSSACLLASLVWLVAAGCGQGPSPTRPATAAPAPSGPPILAPTPAPAFGLTWGLVEDVERPPGAFTIPSDLPTAPAGPGTAGHPGHFVGQSILRDVAVGGDRLVAVGYTAVRGVWTADAWTSTDGRHWRLHAIDDRPGAFAEAVAAVDGGFVAVGRAGSEPAAWTSADGAAWSPARVGRLASGAGVGEPERIAAIAVTPDGLVAGGSAGPELGDRRARLWRSTDGRTWTPVSDADAFEGGEVVAIDRGAGGYVALGRLGTGQRATASVAWISPEGDRWTRIDDPALAGGLVAALVRGPGGWLAVGSDGDEREAVAWSSANGMRWSRAPSEASRLHVGEKIRMTDVVATSEGFVGVGNYVGVQFGQGTTWLSADGLRWQEAPLQAAFGQAEPEAVVAWRDRLAIVGSRGAPDDYIPSAWISPNVP